MTIPKYLFRAPVFPIIIIGKNKPYSAFSPEECSEFSHSDLFGDETNCEVIDSTGENWHLMKENFIFHPLVFSKKNWTKKEIIEVFNSSNLENAKKSPYSTKSISNRTIGKVVHDIAALISGL